MKNKIWALMVDKKVFTLKDLVKEMEQTKYKIFGKAFIKNKVKDFIKQQLQKEIIVPVASGIYAIREYADNWEQYIQKKKCIVCSKEFVPFEDKQMFCSKECKKEYYKLYHQTKRHKGKKDRNYQNWQQWEDELLIQEFSKNGNIRFNRAKAKILTQKLGRTEEAIKERLKILRKGVLS